MGIEAELIEHILTSQAINRDGVLVVHSSFRHLSQAGFRSELFCEELLRSMRGGTVLMPAMTWRTVTPDNPVFDELNTPGHTGILGETFRQNHATHRSLHPTHSVSGCGPLAATLLSSHHFGTTPCPATSPYGLMRDYDSYILLLGVDMESCTAIHHPEEVIAPDLYVRPVSESESYDLIDRNGDLHKVTTRRHLRLARDFTKFVPMLAADGSLSQGSAYNTSWMLFPARNLYRIVFSQLIENPNSTLTALQ